MSDRVLEPLLAGIGAPAALALSVRRDGKLCWQGAAGAADWDADGVTSVRPFLTDTKVRVASVSKLAVALLAVQAHNGGALDLDASIADVLPELPVRADGSPVTLRTLLSHTSGVRDGEVYWQAHPGDVRALIPADGIAEPGFGYANFNYGLAASVLEVRLGARFDELMRSRVLGPLGLKAGLNWSGVPEADRRAGAALVERDAAGRWSEVVDGIETRLRQPAAVLIEPGADLGGYHLGQNGTLFSPQGGLRASAGDLAVLAEAVGHLDPQDPALLAVWRAPSPDVPETEGGFYLSFATGIHRLLPSQWPSGAKGWGDAPLFGHAGEAYGLLSGAWFAPDARVAFGFVVTGVDEAGHKRSTGGLTAIEMKLFELAAQAAAHCARPLQP